jgi:ABC-2 type transport system permease protein
MTALAKLTHVESKLLLRDGIAAFFTLAFPPLLLVILGSVPAFRQPNPDIGGQRVIDLYVPIVIGLVLAFLGLSTLPTYLAGYREKGVLRRLSTTPLHPAMLLLAQLAMSVVVAVIVVALVLAIGMVAFHTPAPAQVVGFLGAFVLTAASLLALGLLIAAVAPSARVATGIGLLLFYPMNFFAGLWLPREAMPETLRRIGDFTPLGAGVQSLQDAMAGAWPSPLHLAVLAVCALLAGLAAVRAFRWE